MWISIHAPARGATLCDKPDSSMNAYFNPRSREGSDGKAKIYNHDRYNFNPRSREGSDLAVIASFAASEVFQSTLPRGERLSSIRTLSNRVPFQSTLPRGERQGFRKRGSQGLCISIHAPARGATAPPPFGFSGPVFQSTLPRGERPYGFGSNNYIIQGFQSTLPRGERRWNDTRGRQ